MSARVWSLQELVEICNRKAPFSSAEDWDPTGLMVGSPRWSTSKVLVALDLTDRVLEAAIQQGAGLIVTHHPCFFPKGKGLTQLNPERSVAVRALESRIGVVALHTCFDRSAKEVGKSVALGLGLEPRGQILDQKSTRFQKLVVFVPETHFEVVRAAVLDAGAGFIGRYDRCGFAVRGEGSFRGGAGTQPSVGQVGIEERVTEVRFEVIVSEPLVETVVRALKSAHPYEEIAFELYPLERTGVQLHATQTWNPGQGYGVWGEFPQVKSFSEFVRDVKKTFNVQGFWTTPHLSVSSDFQIKRVGFTPGKGTSFISSAAQLGCDVFITGEVGFHAAREAAAAGMTVIELGHRESEVFFAPTVKSWLHSQGVVCVMESEGLTTGTSFNNIRLQYWENGMTTSKEQT